MDRTEYEVKLDRINELVDDEDYEGALEIVDTIDWRRVKSVRTLCMVADIYEVNDLLKESKRILLLAYKRSSVGKIILYRLVELSLKMGLIDEAVDYYTEFLQTAPGDNSKYILKYQIYRAKGTPIRDQIAILKEYKEKEYTERWAYELAQLYQKADMIEECIEECDELILWFSEGYYVTKAMELKMEYRSLTPEQQEKYDNRERYDEEEESESELPESPQKSQNKAVLQKLESAGVEAAEAVKAAQDAAVEAAAAIEPIQRETAESDEEVWEKEETAVIPEQQEDEIDPEPEIQIPSIEPEKLKEKLATSLRDVFSGFHRGKEEVQKELASREEEIPEIDQEEIDYQSIKELEPESFNRTVIVHGSDLERMREPDAAEDKVKTAAEDQLEAAMKDLELEPEEAEIEEVIEEPEEAEIEEVIEEPEEAEIEEVIEEPEEAEIEEVIEEPEEAEIEEEVEEPEEAEIEEEVEEPGEAEIEEEVEEPQSGKAEVEEPEGVMETEEEEEAEELEELKDLIQIEEEVEPQEDEEESADEDIESRPKEVHESEMLLELRDEIDQMIDDAVKESGEMMDEESESEEDSKEDETEGETGEEPQEDEPEKESIPQRTIPFRRVKRKEELTEEQKKLFSYFAMIPGMEEQILEAMNHVYDNLSDKTSRHGNIAVMGAEGSGKTRLMSGLVRAISHEIGLEAVKIAKISGSLMDEKDPAKVVSKMAGGFLMIENAAAMTAETIEKFSQALEFRTDGLVVLIEEEKNGMREIFKSYPNFAEKFESVISIPVFTNDELVTFARTYARESGYKIDEMGVLALYTRIGEQQTEGAPMTVALVKELVDKAILKAHRGKLTKKVSGKRIDPEGRIILFEKDFNF